MRTLAIVPGAFEHAISPVSTIKAEIAIERDAGRA